MNISRDVILAVKELYERYPDVITIATKLGISADKVQMAIDIINNLC
jgi:hypothetical protein